MEITSVASLLQRIAAVRPAAQPHSHARWWFRGQPDATHDLRPGVFRSTFPGDAMTRLNNERHLTQDFRVMSAGLVGRNASDAEIYFLQQHYGMPTRLLDWTTNAIAALYFAVSKKPDLAQDGRVFAMDAYQLCQVQGAPGEYEGIATSRRPLFKRMLTPIFDWKNELVPGFTLAVRPDHSDVRIRLQRGCFTFHV